MKFRMFKIVEGGEEIAVNVDGVDYVENFRGKTRVYMASGSNFDVVEDFATVFARLNTVAE